ncbi:unnamed protein product [Microthlaspi erraticum]|uniref:Uncharacterized protein n=1 Tax=Microthlaspi erraticum TaxID=1685480 RepID=A0A6D2HN34_9BRAS|nr:unnamed protein product [Microthlaspi erraticum]
MFLKVNWTTLWSLLWRVVVEVSVRFERRGGFGGFEDELPPSICSRRWVFSCNVLVRAETVWSPVNRRVAHSILSLFSFSPVAVVGRWSNATVDYLLSFGLPCGPFQLLLFSLARRTKLRKFGRARRSSRRPKVTILIWKDRYLSHASRRSGMKPFGSTMRPRLIFYRDMSGKRVNEAHGGFGVSNGPSSSAKGLDRIEKRPG